MSAAELLPEACQATLDVVRGAAGAPLDGRCPSHGDLLGLGRHFIGTTGAFAKAGSGALDPADPWGSDVQVSDWSDQLAANLETIPHAWSSPASWQGSVDTGGGDMPAQALGEMALIEIILHGWDIAVATGQPLAMTKPLAAEVLRAVSETAEQGRQYGAYGPEVRVPDHASDLDHALGLAGRDPRWVC